MNKLGKHLLIGLKGFGVSVITMLIMVIPAWVIKWLWNAKETLVLSAIFGIVWILFYFIVWGWLANKFWRWK